MVEMLHNLTLAWINLRHDLRTRYLNGQIQWEQLVAARARLETAYDTRWNKIKESF